MIKLRKQEEVCLIKRRHRFILIKGLFGISLVFILIIVLMGIAFFASFSFPESLTDALPFLLNYKARILVLFLLSLTLLALWQSVFIIVANYYLDCWIVTDERTIHTELKSLFNRNLSSVPHNRVQDITVEVNGIIPTFFRYGDLQIQTAGKFHEFIFKQIPFPYDTKEVVFNAQRKYFKKMRKKGISPEDAMQDEAQEIPLTDDELPSNE